MTLGGVFASESANDMPLPTKFFVSPMRRPGETLGLEWGWLFKAGAVSRPGSPSPAHSPLPGLSAPSSTPNSPSKAAKAKPAQAQANSAAAAAQAAGARLSEAVKGGRDGIVAPTPMRAMPGMSARPGSQPASRPASQPGSASGSKPNSQPSSKPGSPPKINVGGATPTTPSSSTPTTSVPTSAPAPGTNSVKPAHATKHERSADEIAHVKAILASSTALSLPEAQGGMSHGVPGLVIEEMREHLHVHACDKRLTLTELRALFPHFTFPEAPDEDTVWKPISVRGRETEDEMVARAGRGLEILFDMAQEDRYVSLTAHSGLLRAVYKNLGIPYRRLVTGEMNVLVVRVRKVPEVPELQNGVNAPL